MLSYNIDAEFIALGNRRRGGGDDISISRLKLHVFYVHQSVPSPAYSPPGLAYALLKEARDLVLVVFALLRVLRRHRKRERKRAWVQCFLKENCGAPILSLCTLVNECT